MTPFIITQELCIIITAFSRKQTPEAIVRLQVSGCQGIQEQTPVVISIFWYRIFARPMIRNIGTFSRLINSMRSPNLFYFVPQGFRLPILRDTVQNEIQDKRKVFPRNIDMGHTHQFVQEDQIRVLVKTDIPYG